MSNTPGALIAMSGGVDSTVAAYLMKQAGCRCMGATMRLYQNEDLGQSGFHTCCSAKDVEDAAEVAFQLDIPFEVVNYTEEFREQVRLHDDRIEELFGVRPTSFRNTELIYNNALARTVEEMGYKVSMIEFTPLEHTSKNIMIKAVKGMPYKKLQQKAADEYSRLKEFYNVNPAIDMLKKD